MLNGIIKDKVASVAIIKDKVADVANVISDGVGDVSENISNVVQNIVPSKGVKHTDSTFGQLSGSNYIPNNSGVALAMHPTARVMTIKGVLLDILISKFDIARDLAHLVVMPIMAVIDIYPYYGILDDDTFRNMRNRRQLDCFMKMNPSELDSVMNIFDNIRDQLPGGNRAIFDNKFGLRLDIWEDLAIQVKGLLFGGLDMSLDFVSKLVPNAIAGIFELEDMFRSIVQAAMQSLKYDLTRHQTFTILSAYTDEYTYQTAIPNNDTLPQNSRPKCDYCVKPVVDVTRDIIELVTKEAELILKLTKGVAGLTLDVLLLIFDVCIEAKVNILALKIGILNLFRYATIEVVEAFLSFDPFAPFYDSVPVEGTIPGFALDRLPGGKDVFQQFLIELRAFYTYYFNLLHGLNLMPNKFTCGEFSDMMSYMMRIGDGSKCMTGMCYEDLVGLQE